MAEKSWNKNVRFNRNSESAMQAWSLLHSDEVEKEFKSQNEFVICAINDYYERHLRKKRDPYLETREKEDAFVERIVAQVAEKTLANLPTLAGMYLIQQQAVLTAGFQSTVTLGFITIASLRFTKFSFCCEAKRLEQMVTIRKTIPNMKPTFFNTICLENIKK